VAIVEEARSRRLEEEATIVGKIDLIMLHRNDDEGKECSFEFRVFDVL